MLATETVIVTVPEFSSTLWTVTIFPEMETLAISGRLDTAVIVPVPSRVTVKESVSFPSSSLIEVLLSVSEPSALPIFHDTVFGAVEPSAH